MAEVNDPAIEALQIAASMASDEVMRLLMATILVLAADDGVTPREFLELLYSSPRWPTDEEWEAEAPRIARRAKNGRAMYRAEVRLEHRRNQG